MGNQTKLELTRQVIYSTLVAEKTWTRLDKLARLYQRTEGRSVPFADLGYKNLHCFLETMSDRVQLHEDGTFVYAKAKESVESAHISKLVRETKASVNQRRRNNYDGYNNNNSHNRYVCVSDAYLLNKLDLLMENI